MSRNKEDQVAYSKKYYQEHRLKRLEYSRRYYQSHREEVAEYSRRHYQAHKLEIVGYHRKYHQAHKLERMNRDLEIKCKTLSHYSNGNLACVMCGFDDIRALSIDHINGKGTKHRERMGILGSHIYVWLEKNNYPEGYQTLCMNCQFIKRTENKECAWEKWSGDTKPYRLVVEENKEYQKALL